MTIWRLSISHYDPETYEDVEVEVIRIFSNPENAKIYAEQYTMFFHSRQVEWGFDDNYSKDGGCYDDIIKLKDDENIQLMITPFKIDVSFEIDNKYKIAKGDLNR